MLYTCANPVKELLLAGQFSWQARTLSVAARPYCALAFRCKGGGTLSCGDKVYTLQPGEVLYMPQGLSYDHNYTDTNLLLFHFVTAENDSEPEIYRPKNPEDIGRQFQKAIAIWEKKEPGYMANCISIFYKILAMLGESEATRRLPSHFLRAVSLLNENFCRNDLRIDEICRSAAISQTVFRQLFQQHYGKSPVQYLTELRLEHARSRIADGESVESAALASGFSDAKYFARVVKRHYGCTPRQLTHYGNA